MGLLESGTPLRWSEIKPLSEELRMSGIRQIIHLLKRFSTTNQEYPLLWGDELEFQIVRIDNEAKSVRLLCAFDKVKENFEKKGDEVLNLRINPEYAAYMLELTPKDPYPESLDALSMVEDNMRERRQSMTQFLPDPLHDHIISFAAFPLLGVHDSLVMISGDAPMHNEYSQSLYIPDSAINSHPRFTYAYIYIDEMN